VESAASNVSLKHSNCFMTHRTSDKVLKLDLMPALGRLGLHLEKRRSRSRISSRD